MDNVGIPEVICPTCKTMHPTFQKEAPKKCWCCGTILVEEKKEEVVFELESTKKSKRDDR